MKKIGMAEEKLAFLRGHTPCYLYQEAAIISQYRKLQEALPDIMLLYSVKTNPFAPIMKTLARLGAGADAASVQEVLLAQASGMGARSIFYSAPGKTPAAIRQSAGACIIIADSLYELMLLEAEAVQRGKTLAVGIRINPNFQMHEDGGASSKFGIDEALLPELEETLKRCPHLRLAGIHVHLRSQVLDAETLCSYYQNCFRLAERVSAFCGGRLDFINFGSGIGVVYDAERDVPLDLDLISATMREISARNRQTLRAVLCIETGRFLVCHAGTYYTKVLDIKESYGKKYLIVENAMNGFFRPALAALLKQNFGEDPCAGQEPLYTTTNECMVQVLNSETQQETVDVVGNLCTALDVMIRDVSLNRAQVGDLVSVSNAGSYGYTLSPQLFSSQPLPGQYYETESGQIKPEE